MRALRIPVLLTATLLIGMPVARAAAQVRLTTSAGDVVIFSEKNLVDHLIVVDSVALETAQLAAKRTQNVAVRDLANMLTTDYRAHLETMRKIAAEHEVGRQASPSDTAGAVAIRALTSLNGMAADSSFDRAFVREQIRLAQQEVVALKMLGGAAKDGDLKDEVKRAIPIHERHLVRAREVAAQLGIPADSTKSPATKSP
jgi:predicted outer membrane protein